MLNTGKTPKVAAEDSNERKEKTSSDRWMIWLTGVLEYEGEDRFTPHGDHNRERGRFDGVHERNSRALGPVFTRRSSTLSRGMNAP